MMSRAITLQRSVPVDPLFSVEVPIPDYVCSIDNKAEPFAMRRCRRINLYPVGASTPYQGPSYNGARAQGSKGGWDPSTGRRLSASECYGHTSNLGISNVSFVSLSFRRSLFHFQNGAFRHQTCLEIA